MNNLAYWNCFYSKCTFTSKGYFWRVRNSLKSDFLKNKSFTNKYTCIWKYIQKSNCNFIWIDSSNLFDSNGSQEITWRKWCFVDTLRVSQWVYVIAPIPPHITSSKLWIKMRRMSIIPPALHIFVSSLRLSVMKSSHRIKKNAL